MRPVGRRWRRRRGKAGKKAAARQEEGGRAGNGDGNGGRGMGGKKGPTRSQPARQAGSLGGRTLAASEVGQGKVEPQKSAEVGLYPFFLFPFLPNSTRPSLLFFPLPGCFQTLGSSRFLIWALAAAAARVVSLVAPLSILDLWGNAAPVVQLVNTPSLAPRCSFL